MPPMMVNQCIAQDPVKPCDCSLVFPDAGQLVEALQHRGLENVFRELTIAQASFQKAEKRSPVLQKRGQRPVFTLADHGTSTL